MNSRIESLLEQLTIEEKISLLAGASAWYTEPVERLNIPAIKMTDGPNGARGITGYAGHRSAACFPVGISLASTWNPALVEQVGQALGEETKSKGARVLLAPTVNIHRSPLNGRNFECYSEDPYLSGRMAIAYIKGVQSRQVGATIKHFVCNDSEFERHNISSEVGERALREIYLPPFKTAIEEATPWAIMAAYNKINGLFAADYAHLLTDILRNEWGFDGVIMSDWFGLRSTVKAVQAGLDLEMPGPPLWRGEKLLDAFRNGDVDEDTITERVRRMLQFIERVGAFEHPDIPGEQVIDKPEHRILARTAAAEGMVLLKNTGILPLDKEKLHSLAIIGPNARMAQIMGGGSAHVTPHYAIMPYTGIINNVGDSVKISYEIGCTNHKRLPAINPEWIIQSHTETTHGLTVEYFNNFDLAGEPAWKTTSTYITLNWFGEFAHDVDPEQFSVRLSGIFIAPESGTFIFSLSSNGRSRLEIAGEVIDRWTEQIPGEETCRIEMNAGQHYELKVEYSRGDDTPFPLLHVGCQPPIAEDSIQRAARLAAQSDAALVFVGLSDEWESEGFDRADMELAGRQNELIHTVAGANENTVVIVNTGSPVSMRWLEQAAAVLQVWFPGQECGNAIADILFGDVNPSGKLPQTFPKRLQDNPAYLNYPGENGKVVYGEGIFVGYRYYDKKKIEPLFPFGFGLSYTTFEYSNLHLSAAEIEPEDTLRVFVNVKNTGDRAGQEVVQVYVRDRESSLMRPEKELKGFAKVTLEPGESKTVEVTLNREALAYYDDLARRWVAEAGTFEVLAGSSSRDIRATGVFRLNTTARFGGPEQKGVWLSAKSTIRKLLQHEEARNVLDKHLPGLLDSPHIQMMPGFSLEQVIGFAPEKFPDHALHTIEKELAEL